MQLYLPPFVETSGCRLARWTVEHAPALRVALAASEAHLRPWTPWVIDGKVPGMSLAERLAQHEAQFDAGAEWVYGLFSADGAEVLGGCGLYPRIGPRAVEIGYWLSAAHTGRGLATRAARVLTALALASPEIDRVEIRCERGNAASARVPERLGFERPDDAGEGAHDLLAWRLTRDRWMEQTAAARAGA